MEHSVIAAAQRHGPCTWEVGTESARLALSTSSLDIGKWCWQKSDDTFWALRAVGQWKQISSDGTSSNYMSGAGTPQGIVTAGPGTFYGRTDAARVYFKASGTGNTGWVEFTTTPATGGATVPGAPQGLSATAGNGLVNAAWSAPASNGGSTITGYRIVWSGGQQVTVGNTLSAVISGVTNGTPGSVLAYAINAEGESVASNPSNTVTPVAGASVPGAPTIGTATAGDASASITGTPPASNGGAPIDGYRAVPYIGGVAGTPGPVSSTLPATIPSGLTNGTGYTFTLQAHNSVGWGLESEPSNSVTPQAIGGIGGIAVGSVGAAGSIYEGYTLSWGDDFEALDILAPHRPRGKWHTTRTYLAGARGSDTLLGTMYDTDPFMTGYKDSNRGVPVGYGNMSQSGSVLSLQARRATAPEKLHFQGAGRNEVAAMISGPGVVHWYPAAAGAGDIIFEGRIRFSVAAGNPGGWHPTLWLQSLNPVIAIDSDELDWEGSSQGAYLNQNIWTGGGSTSNTAGAMRAHDGAFHDVAFVINTSSVRLYIDGALYATGAWNGNIKAKPQYPLLTSHIFNGTYKGDAYSQAAWNADANGASLDVDWMRVWRRTGRQHFAPLAAANDVNVAYGASTTITIPSTLAVWGDAGVTEYLQCAYNEENEPGVDHTTAYAQFPPGVSYNTGTRQLTVNITSGKTGRLNFVLSAWKADGSTGEPLRFAVNVGPVINTANFAINAGTPVSVDLYTQVDCGVLTSNGTSKAKTIAVTGLSGSGLSYNDTTGLLTGTGAQGGYNLSITATNSVGQSATKAVTLTVNAAVAGGSGLAAPTLTSGVAPTYYWDFDDDTTVAHTSGAIDAITSKGLNTQVLSGAAAKRPTRVLRSGKYVGDFTAANVTVLQALGLTVPTGSTMVAIVELKSTSAAQVIFDKAISAAATTNSRESLIAGAAPSPGWLGRKGGTSAYNDAVVGTPNTTARHLVIGRVKPAGTEIAIWLDGGAAVISGAAPADGAAQDTLTIGARRGAGADSLPLNGYVSAVLVYPGTLTGADAEEIAVWSATNYGTANT